MRGEGKLRAPLLLCSSSSRPTPKPRVVVVAAAAPAAGTASAQTAAAASEATRDCAAASSGQGAREAAADCGIVHRVRGRPRSHRSSCCCNALSRLFFVFKRDECCVAIATAAVTADLAPPGSLGRRLLAAPLHNGKDGIEAADGRRNRRRMTDLGR